MVSIPSTWLPGDLKNACDVSFANSLLDIGQVIGAQCAALQGADMTASNDPAFDKLGIK